MSLESFIGLDGSEPMSESAFEALKQKMKAAQAQVAAIRKEEKKQKKKEDELIKILFKFIKSSQKTDLVLLISRVLEKNIPANFILAIILLGNEDIQKEVGSFLMLEAPEEGAQPEAAVSDQALIFFNQNDETLPLKIKIEMDTWMKGLLYQAEERPQKLLKTAYKIEFTEDEEIKTLESSLIKLMAFVVRDYLSQNKQEEPYENLTNFAEFILKGVLNKTRENLDNRQFLEGDTPIE